MIQSSIITKICLGIGLASLGVFAVSTPVNASIRYPIQGFYAVSPMSVGSSYTMADSVIPKVSASTASAFPITDYNKTLFNNLVTSPDSNDICQYSFMYNSLSANITDNLTSSFTLGFPTVIDPQNQRTCFEYKKSFTDVNGDNPLNVDSIPNNPILDWIDFGFQSDRDFYVQFLLPYYYRQSGWLRRVQTGDVSNRTLNFYNDILQMAFGEVAPLTHLELPLIVPDLESCWISRSSSTYEFSGHLDLGEEDYFTDYSESVDSNNSFFGIRVYYYTTDDGNGSSSNTFIDFPFDDYSFESVDDRVILHMIGDFTLNSYYLQSYDFFTIELVFDFNSETNHPQPLWSGRALNFDNLVITDNFEGDSVTCEVGLNQSGNSVGGVYQDPHEGDWLYKLQHLFDFGFVNPFIPMFNLFTDGSECAQIPIMAEMLHFEEGQVCPFFDQQTRSIVTPVFAMVSMIILISFLYRWLSSSSGNFTSDSDSKNNGGV